MWSIWRGTKKEVIGVWTISANFENLNQIKELPVDVSYYCDRCLDMDHVALLHQQLLGLGAYCFDDGFSKQVLLVKAFNAFIEIDGRCREARISLVMQRSVQCGTYKAGQAYCGNALAIESALRLKARLLEGWSLYMRW